MARRWRLGWWVGALGLVLAAGCAAPGPARLPVCPGKASVAEALAALSAGAAQAVPVRASGQCRLNYYVPDDDKEKRHNLPMMLWFNPPSEIYIQGSIAVDPKAVIIGSNAEEFWLTMRPKEMSSYYWGQWEQAGNVDGLMVSPRVVLEAFGIVALHDEGSESAWSLDNQGAYDVLAQQDETGRVLKRVHVYTCDYLVRKIEYFGRDGAVIAEAELDDYDVLGEGFHVPKRISVTTVVPDQRKDTINIKLNSMRVKELTERQRNAIFVRPDTGRYEHMYRYEGGRWVAEQ